jgi:hypothetical protein
LNEASLSLHIVEAPSTRNIVRSAEFNDTSVTQAGPGSSHFPQSRAQLGCDASEEMFQEALLTVAKQKPQSQLTKKDKRA